MAGSSTAKPGMFTPNENNNKKSSGLRNCTTITLYMKMLTLLVAKHALIVHLAHNLTVLSA